MTRKVSVLELIPSCFPYLRSAKARFLYLLGGPWSSEVVTATKARLRWVMLKPDSKQIKSTLSPGRMEIPWRGNDQPKAGTFLRLGFHDCLRYTDGTGGCDGCLNWAGMGFRRNDKKDSFSDPDVLLSDNNGLAQVVEVLEELYTIPTYLAKEAGVSSAGPSLRDQGEIVTALEPSVL